MATVTSQVRAVLTALAAALALREDMAGVTVFRRTPSPRALEGLTEWVVLAIRATGRQSFPMASTRVKYDAMSITGQIAVEQDNGRDTDDAADSAQERAEELLAEIEDALRTSPSLGRVGRTVLQLTDYEHTFTGDDTKRIHLLTFTIENNERMHSS
jgi:hypothetical protein